ncbi:MAG: BON domain-containing protein [Nitrospirota bacterium]
MVKRYLAVAAALVVMAALAACAGSQTTRSSGVYLDDKTITAKINADLIGDPMTKAHQIDVNTYKGVVQLSGFVDTKEAIKRAGEIARSTKGVVSVENNLQLRTKTP